MQIQTLDMNTCEVNPHHHHRIKYDSLVAPPQHHDHEESAAEGLSQLLSNKFVDMNPSMGHGSPSPANMLNLNASASLESALAPQKVRTERYVKVSVKGVSVARQKNLYLSWFLDNNGLPDCCLLMIPERHPNVIISFKGTHGWIEVDTNHCRAPEFEIQFELKLHHALLNRRRYVQNQPIVLRFFLLDKREDGSINNVGEILLSVLLMSSKCANRTLIAHLVKEDTKPQRDSVSLPMPMPLVMPMTDNRKLYEEHAYHHQHVEDCAPMPSLVHHGHTHHQNPSIYSQN